MLRIHLRRTFNKHDRRQWRVIGGCLWKVVVENRFHMLRSRSSDVECRQDLATAFTETDACKPWPFARALDRNGVAILEKRPRLPGSGKRHGARAAHTQFDQRARFVRR